MNRTHKRHLSLSLSLSLSFSLYYIYIYIYISLHLRLSLSLTSPEKHQRNKQITFSPEHIFAPKFTPRYTPISRTMSSTHVQPFFRVDPTLVSVATSSMQTAQCHLRVHTFAFPPFPPSRISPKSFLCHLFYSF